MPAVSKNQRIAAAIAEHEPSKLFARNQGLASMSLSELHKFASTKAKSLPRRVRRHAGLVLLTCLLPMRVSAQKLDLTVMVPLAPAAQTTAAAQSVPADLSLPTWIYLGTAAGDWASAATCFEVGCGRTPLTITPGIQGASASVPLGLAIEGGVLYAAHRWLGPRWPRVAAGVLYGLSFVRTATTTDKIISARTAIRAGRSLGVPE